MGGIILKKIFRRFICFAVCIAMVMPTIGTAAYVAGEEETIITASGDFVTTQTFDTAMEEETQITASSFTTTPIISADVRHTVALRSDGTVWACV